jgi:GTP-binding protein HflX
MTKASVLSADMLFATLDPTLRAVNLPHGTRVILSDTVGFISDLPTMLVAAFRATLEEVIEADVILHVRDVAHADTEAQAQDVADVLRQLGIEGNGTERVIEVWNKVDKLDTDARAQVENLASRQAAEHRPVLVSALSGEGIAALTAAIEGRVAANRPTFDLILDPADGAGLSWLYRNAEVIAKTLRDDHHLAVTVRVDPAKAERLRAKFGASATSA